MKRAANKRTHVTHGPWMIWVFAGRGNSAQVQGVVSGSFEDRQEILAKGTAKNSGGALPSVSELLNGKIANKGVDKLLYYAGRLGIEAKARFVQTHKEAAEKELSLAD